MSKFTLKDSGKRQTFETGYQRDTEDGKAKFVYVPTELLKRLAYIYEHLALEGDTNGSVQLTRTLTNFADMFEDLHPEARYDLFAMESLERLAVLYGRGAVKYNDDNWRKGAPFGRVYNSLFRHLIAWFEGDRSEDHLAAIAWNALTLAWYETKIKSGELPSNLNDIGINLEGDDNG